MSTSHVVSSARASGESGGEIVRYTLSERVHHWLGSLFYIYCLITGLAFWSPYMYWLAALVGGGPTARFWHPWFGLAFTVSMVWMYMMWRGDLATTEADRRWSKSSEPGEGRIQERCAYRHDPQAEGGAAEAAPDRGAEGHERGWRRHCVAGRPANERRFLGIRVVRGGEQSEGNCGGIGA